MWSFSHRIDQALYFLFKICISISFQGIIVLSRQWKNTLYNPILFEHQYKNKLTRPINVTFSFPQNEEECEDQECEGDNDLGAYAGVGDNPEESENALLLGQTQHHRTHIGILLINAFFILN